MKQLLFILLITVLSSCSSGKTDETSYSIYYNPFHSKGVKSIPKDSLFEDCNVFLDDYTDGYHVSDSILEVRTVMKGCQLATDSVYTRNYFYFKLFKNYKGSTLIIRLKMPPSKGRALLDGECVDLYPYLLSISGYPEES